MTTGLGVIANMMRLLGNDFLLPIIILIATGGGIILLIDAVIDVTKKMAVKESMGAGARETTPMIAAKFIIGGALLMGGTLGGFNLLTYTEDMIFDTAVKIAQDGEGYKQQAPWDGLTGAWDGLTGAGGDSSLPDYKNYLDDNAGKYEVTIVTLTPTPTPTPTPDAS
jgi:hypothetical protein